MGYDMIMASRDPPLLSRQRERTGPSLNKPKNTTKKTRNENHINNAVIGNC